MKTYKIAIDGPAGVGKSTIAKRLASLFHFTYVDTGAMYRTIALYYIEKRLPLENEEVVLSHLNDIEISLRYIDGMQNIFLNGKNVTDLIRTPEVSTGSSQVAVIGGVREKLVKLQREIGEKQNVVMDGRDIGTKVFPDADVKLFLTATCEERAKRRMAEMREKGMQASYDEILESIRFRDENDSNRKIDPLKPASDAIMVDNTQDTLEQTVERIKNIIKERLK
ncbi:(d)CMP kinase [Acetivibrio sp. MSJd-27]|jgi:cytidylate kinase|uniref:(d)CMP kinase n=1 Tax=Acetivibrio sp. MSJd-27 TaxID=2841523 RepID=UPI001C1188CC|nr:(d)CMP kinase [Acetivibrio sp. MSJd-27]MBU5449669.1 (d)CMP kinase [Acetivibrio sp. MSJd-27]